MLNTPLFKTLFFILVLIGFLHILATKLYFYWTIWWFDIPMHYLGGFWVAIVFLWLYYYSGLFENPKGSNLRILLLAFLSALVIGILWEVFEYQTGMIFWPEDKTDSYMDLVFDLLGSLSAYLFVSKMRMKNDAKQ